MNGLRINQIIVSRDATNKLKTSRWEGQWGDAAAYLPPGRISGLPQAVWSFEFAQELERLKKVA